MGVACDCHTEAALDLPVFAPLPTFCTSDTLKLTRSVDEFCSNCLSMSLQAATTNDVKPMQPAINAKCKFPDFIALTFKFDGLVTDTLV